MTKGIERVCDFCSKEYIPKSNNSKFCSRKCNNKAHGKRRTKRYQTNPEYRKHILKQLSNRFKSCYHNEPGFKEKHMQEIKDYRKTKKGREFTNANARKTYHNHPEYNERNKKDHREKYHSDSKWRKRVNQRNRMYLKTGNGRLADKRHHSKRRGLSHIALIPNVFPDELPVEDHHINNLLVIPMPSITHNYVCGSVSGREHWRFNALWIKRLYDIDVKCLLNGDM